MAPIDLTKRPRAWHVIFDPATPLNVLNVLDVRPAPATADDRAAALSELAAACLSAYVITARTAAEARKSARARLTHGQAEGEASTDRTTTHHTLRVHALADKARHHRATTMLALTPETHLAVLDQVQGLLRAAYLHRPVVQRQLTFGDFIGTVTDNTFSALYMYSAQILTGQCEQAAAVLVHALNSPR